MTKIHRENFVAVSDARESLQASMQASMQESMLHFSATNIRRLACALKPKLETVVCP